MPKARLVPAAVIDFDQIAISTSPPRPTNIAVTGRINRSAGASSDVHARMLRLLAVEGVRPSSISRRHRLRRSHGRAENCNCSGNGNEALLAHKSPTAFQDLECPTRQCAKSMRSEEHTSELQSLMR